MVFFQKDISKDKKIQWGSKVRVGGEGGARQAISAHGLQHFRQNFFYFRNFLYFISEAVFYFISEDYYSIFSFMCNVLQIVVRPFVLFLFAIVLSDLLRFTDSAHPFGIFKLFLSPIMHYPKALKLFYPHAYVNVLEEKKNQQK